MYHIQIRWYILYDLHNAIFGWRRDPVIRLDQAQHAFIDFDLLFYFEVFKSSLLNKCTNYSQIHSTKAMTFDTYRKYESD